MSKIPEHLIEKVKSIPSKPGVYQMKDVHGNIIYIGKSKTLISRVKSYFYTQHKWDKIKRMVFHIHDIEIIVTDTHLEAQLLECDLIKKIKPIYNAQFKNHEKYMYLKIENYNRFKPIVMVKEREDENCFGPYRNKSILLEVINFFQNIYPLTKSEGTYEFTYNIIPQTIDIETFTKNKENLIEIFSKKECMLEFLSQIKKKMNEAAENFQFETASVLRDMLNNIKYLYDNDTREFRELKSKKILIGEKIDDGYKLFYISNDSIILKKKYKKVIRKNIDKFLVKAKELEENLSDIKNEKRDLDFKHIVNAEIQDQDSKSVLFLKSNYSVDKFINKLLKIN